MRNQYNQLKEKNKIKQEEFIKGKRELQFKNNAYELRSVNHKANELKT